MKNDGLISEPESIQTAREVMPQIKQALTKQDGKFPDADWELRHSLVGEEHQTAWQDMEVKERLNLLTDGLREMVWSLEAQDGPKLATEFIHHEEVNREQRHDSGLRHLEDRGVRYEDSHEQHLNEAAKRGSDKPKDRTPKR